jgi:high-affinity iron transporter
MLPTFVIGLREGLEAALIVGIIAAFLGRQGRRDLVRWVFVGVATAVLLCVAVGAALDVLSQNLPQRQQEGLETVIGAAAVAMVTYMVVWMRRHSRQLKGQLEGLAADAISGPGRGGRAMIVMAFLAVLREGFETVVFLLAAFNESGSGASAPFGATLGIAVAVALGYGIYRGGVRLNLARFFRATGLVLVLVAAGLVVNALHTAHEAGWLDVGQLHTVDLSALVRPGSVQASLLTGMLGIQPRPVLIEVVGWFVYLVPVGLYVVWPPGRSVPAAALARALLAGAGIAAAATLLFAVLAPGRPAGRPVSAAGAVTAQLVSRSDDSAVVRTQAQSPAGGGVAGLDDIRLQRTGAETRSGLATYVYAASGPGSGAAGRSATLDLASIAELNGGRLPIGLGSVAGGHAAVRYRDVTQLKAWVEPHTGRVIDLVWTERVGVIVVDGAVGQFALARPIATATAAWPESAVASAVAAARPDLRRIDRNARFVALSWASGVGAAVSMISGIGFAATSRRSSAAARPVRNPVGDLVSS